MAPGLACQFVVQFFPDCLGDFDDLILVETQSSHALLIPLQARRPPPVLTREYPPHLPGLSQSDVTLLQRHSEGPVVLPS